MAEPDYDLITMGRSSIDLYANEIGAPFEQVKSFGAFVGGCPTNIAVGARRLGRRTALLSAVGQDPVGDFVLRFLRDEGVETAFIPRKPGRRTSAVLLAIQPPDRFPIVFYRDNCADIALDEADVAAAPLDRTRALLVTGTGLSAEPSRAATFAAVRRAREAGATTYIDLDLRADQWREPGAYAAAIAELLPSIDVAIGTAEEVRAAAGAGEVRIADDQVTSPEVGGDTAAAVAAILERGPSALVLKRGAAGACVHTREGETIEAEPFRVEVVNVLGAGDAFAAGLLHGRLAGWDWERSLRMGNATGAIVVTRQGCANFMPTEAEALALIEARGEAR